MKTFSLHSKILKTGKTLLLLCSFMLLGCEGFISEESQIAMGLKSALEEGSKYALHTLGKQDGFFLDQTVKIGLPENAAKFVSLVASTPIIGDVVKKTVKELEGELVLAINRAAEVAIEEVIPIVGKSITDMTIQDAKSILFDANQYAATDYLRGKTYDPLCIACGSVIEGALNKKIIANASAQDVWGKFTVAYNQVSDIVANIPFLHLDPLETDLSLYTTQKALNGVFRKVGDEEVKIRTDVSARTNDLLRKVFGMLD